MILPRSGPRVEHAGPHLVDELVPLFVVETLAHAAPDRIADRFPNLVCESGAADGLQTSRLDEVPAMVLDGLPHGGDTLARTGD